MRSLLLGLQAISVLLSKFGQCSENGLDSSEHYWRNDLGLLFCNRRMRPYSDNKLREKIILSFAKTRQRLNILHLTEATAFFLFFFEKSRQVSVPLGSFLDAALVMPAAGRTPKKISVRLAIGRYVPPYQVALRVESIALARNCAWDINGDELSITLNKAVLVSLPLIFQVLRSQRQGLLLPQA